MTLLLPVVDGQVDVTTCDLALNVTLFYFNPIGACSLPPPSLSVSVFRLLTPSDCNRPADRSEDPNSDSDEAVQCSQAAVHSDYG